MCWKEDRSREAEARAWPSASDTWEPQLWQNRASSGMGVEQWAHCMNAVRLTLSVDRQLGAKTGGESRM